MARQMSSQEIVDFLHDALAQWELSHEQLARRIGCSKESVANWLKKKCLPGPRAMVAIERLRDHFQEGHELPPRPTASIRKHDDPAGVSTPPLNLLAESPFAIEAATTVRRFFESIGSRQFSAAWKCLTPAFQDRRWAKGQEAFAAGYDAFISLNNLVVVPLNPIHPPACRVFIYYEDTTNVIDLPGFGNWSLAQLGQIEQCCQALVRLREAVLARTDTRQSIEQIPVSSLFTEQAGNVLHAASQVPLEQFLKAVNAGATRQSVLSVPLIAKVLKAQKNRFLIDQILPVSWGKRI